MTSAFFAAAVNESKSGKYRRIVGKIVGMADGRGSIARRRAFALTELLADRRDDPVDTRRVFPAAVLLQRGGAFLAVMGGQLVAPLEVRVAWHAEAAGGADAVERGDDDLPGADEVLEHRRKLRP